MSSHRFYKRSVISWIVLAALGGAPLASAADSEPAQAMELQEVVVTAQKRTENLEKVPISISVVDQAAITQRGMESTADILTSVPGVDYLSQGVTNNISIRGIYSNFGTSTTGYYIDDVPLQIRQTSISTQIGNADIKLFDLDRVEVLRGPQGTLFGSSAEGGAIRFITPQPSLTDYSGFSRAGLATTVNGGPSYEAGGAFGGPIATDTLGFRVSAWYRRDGGYIDHDSAIPGGYNAPNANWTDSVVLRGAVTYAPTESLKITPSIYYQDDYINDTPGFEPASSSAYNDPFTQNWASLSPRYSNVDSGVFVDQALLQQPLTERFYVPSLKVALEGSGVELTSVTSYVYRNSNVIQDFTNFTPAAFGIPWPAFAGAADTNDIETFQNIFTQEIRAQSTDQSRRLQWTAGLFYMDGRQQIYNDERSPNMPNMFETYDHMSITQVLGENLLPGDLSWIARENVGEKHKAAYGQASYRVFDQWSVIAGLRVDDQTALYNEFQTGPYNGGVTTSHEGTKTQTVIDPKFGLNYQVNENTLIYASATKGDRIGGVNPPGLFIPGCAPYLAALGLNSIPLTYDGDSLWSYELGSKARLFGGRMQIDASAFHIVWSNVQEPISVPACETTFAANLGKASSNGFDLAWTALVTDSLKVGLTVGYTNARQSTTIVSGQEQASTSGAQLNSFASPWSVLPTAEYTITAAGGYKAYVRLDDEYHSRNPGPYAQSILNNASYSPYFIPNPSINQLNMHVGATWNSWDVSVYALNALNSHPVLFSVSQQPVQDPFPGAFTLRPLTIGIAVVKTL
jgi:outer membrane receptor protein involved in Fe transport